MKLKAENLKVGSKIQYKDTRNNWIPSEIIEKPFGYGEIYGTLWFNMGNKPAWTYIDQFDNKKQFRIIEI